jgi:hypothetical protein
MTGEELLRESFVSLEVHDAFTEATLQMRDHSRLVFCHRVGERWARAEGDAGEGSDSTLAGRVLSLMSLFRLNAKHLEVWFEDGSHWETRFRTPRKDQGSSGEPRASD